MIPYTELLKAAAQALAKISEMGTQIAENKGDKIPMQSESIMAKSKYLAEKFQFKEQIKVFEAKQIRKWKNNFKLNNDKFTLLQEGKILNKIEQLVRAGKIIYRMDIVTKERYYLYIRFIEDNGGNDCETWIPLEGKKIG